MKSKRKIYAYVDESGQDTKGLVFVVSVLVLEEQQESILAWLEHVEQESHKGNAKWRKSRFDFRRHYIEEIASAEALRKSIFFETFSDTKKYIQLTSYATAKAILKRASTDYKATVFVDGFRKHELEVFTRGLRDLRIQTRKIRGVKKDENNAFIRLADAICGLVRDAQEGDEWANGILKKLTERGIVTEL